MSGSISVKHHSRTKETEFEKPNEKKMVKFVKFECKKGAAPGHDLQEVCNVRQHYGSK